MERFVYRIRATLLCHDVRLNTSLQDEVEFDHWPNEKEAIHLLWPAGEAVVAKNFCEGCPFELGIVSIELIRRIP